MTPADNLRILLDGGMPEWAPFSMDVGAMPGFTAPLMDRFLRETGAPDPAEYFGFDWRLSSVSARFGGDDPRSLHTQIADGTTFDEWGIGHWSGGTEGTIDRMYPPLAAATTVSQVEALPSPVIEDSPDPPAMRRAHERGFLVFGYGGSLYEWSWFLRGMEAFMMDLASDPAMAEAIIDKVAAHTTRLAQASIKAGIDVLCFYDDVGMQTGMQIAPSHWRRFIKPVWARILQRLRATSPGTRFFLHSCGDIHEILDDIVEVGFHVLHPVQPECMDFAAVQKRLGHRIALCATLSAQRILPFGSPAQVRAEVRRLKSLCPDHRCILCPSNMMQPETPWENVLAFADECAKGRR